MHDHDLINPYRQAPVPRRRSAALRATAIGTGVTGALALSAGPALAADIQCRGP